jgi:hypothetical protein
MKKRDGVRRMLTRAPAFCAFALWITTPAQAGDFTVGIGATDFAAEFAQDYFQLTLEYSGASLASWGEISFHSGAALEVDGKGDYWVGAGVNARRPIGDGPWALEASLMPGFYKDAIEQNDLGGNLQIRTLIGLSYRLDERSVVSIAASHKSNAGIADENPGANAFTLRFRRGF